MTYTIVELRAGETGGYAPRGGGKALWQSKAPETMLAGPAETGKTWSCCQKINALMWKYPGAQAAILRKTQTSLYGSVVVTFKRILGESSPVKPYGGEKPEWFQYPNGSRIWLGGMDNPTRVLSSERDVIYVNQAEELELSDWETLRTRNTGRGGVMPYAQQIGDCNPGPPNHWIKLREKAGALIVFESRHEDNPTLFDEFGNLTAQGRISLAILDSLTGVRYKRLRLGLWVSAEGQVYEGYDPAIHLIDRNDGRYGLQNGVPASWPRLWDVDFGFTNPFVWHEWVQDPDGRLILHKEIYKTKTLVEDHAKAIEQTTKGCPRPRRVICDHDAEDRATLERKLRISTVGAYKSVSDGIQAVASRLKVAGDGKPRILLMRDALLEVDQELLAKKYPICTADEWLEYIWDESNGRKRGEEPVKKFDHGMDGTRYIVADTDGLAPSKDKKPGYDPLSFLTSIR